MQQPMLQSRVDLSSTRTQSLSQANWRTQHLWGLAERRLTSRAIRTFMPACIETEGCTSVALLRDFSRHGAGFESDRSFRIGQALEYRWGDEALREAKVIWVDGYRFGVENTQSSEAIALNPGNYRSVRIDLCATVLVFAGEKRFEGEALNFSQKGLCVLLNGEIKPGSRTTVRVGGKYLENLTARWSDGDRIGFALPTSLPIQEMSKLASGF